MTIEEPLAVLSQFNIDNIEYQLTPVSNGLINQSFIVSRASDNKNLYFLQCINHSIFKDIEGLMNNVKVVCSYFETVENAPAHLELILTKEENSFYISTEKNYWRLYRYIGGDTYFRADNLGLAKEAGTAYGHFLGTLSNLNPEKLAITLPDFHDINVRYKQFQQSLIIASEERKQKAQPWIRLVELKIETVIGIYKKITNTCPIRVTHNDAKLSNLLFDANKKAKCVIDYDTLMPGYIALDFGDSVRTICSTSIEDDPTLDNTKLDMSVFEAFTTQFIKSISNIITKEELEALPKTGSYMAFIMGIRMLTDYLNNDVYYTIDYKEHNYDRASNQLTLYKSALSLESRMKDIIFKHL